MREINEIDEGKIVFLPWDEYKAIRTLSEGWEKKEDVHVWSVEFEIRDEDL